MEISRDARLLFIGLWNFSDDGGNHPASEKTLKAEIFPADEDINSSTIRRMIDELSTNGLIVTYESPEGKMYWHVTGWKHQKIDKPNVKYPTYIPGTEIQPVRYEFDERSSNDRRMIVDESSKGRLPFTPVREGKGRDIEGKDLNLGGEDVINNEGLQHFKKLHLDTCGLATVPPLKIIQAILDKGTDPQRIEDVYQLCGGDHQRYRQRNITERLQSLRDEVFIDLDISEFTPEWVPT
jgi:hypothetical protein